MRAAKACGCAFFPASEAQVQRLSQQRRVFRVAGKPFLLTRDGSFYETHGTLFRLIAEELERLPPESAEPAPVESASVESAGPAPEPAAAVAAVPEPESAPAPKPAPHAVPARRVAATPRPPAAPPPTAIILAEPAPDQAPLIETGTVTDAPALAEATATALFLTEVEPIHLARAVPAEALPLGAIPRAARRHAGKAEPPRWVTAGAERRGRLKPLRARLD